MKKISAFIAFFAALALISACNKDIETVQEPAKEMTISVSIPADGLTRVSLEQDATDPDGVIKLAWEAEDLITVKNAADDSKAVVFSLKDGAGTKSATFTATDASALDGATAFDIYLTSNLPDDCSEQPQAANGSTSHLGYYATLRGVNKFDGVTFSQAWATANGEGTFASSAYLRIRAKMPSAAIAAAVQKVTLKASAEILAGSDEMEITITKPGSDDDIVTVYATLTPESVAVAEGTGLMVQFQVSSDPADKYTAFRELSAKTFAAGKVNAMNINCVNADKFANDTEVNIGTSANPYLIGDRHQMVAMSSFLVSEETKYFLLVDDIDLDGVTWTPLNNASPFDKAVNLDGNGKTISNLGMPLFYTYNGDVSNLTIDEAEITQTKGNYGIFGRQATVADGSVTNVTIKNSSLTTANAIAGALFGTLTKNIVMTGCVAEDVTISGKEQAGGLVGVMQAGSIENCSSSGSVTAAAYYVGGLVGRINGTIDGDIIIKNSHSSADVVSSSGNYSRAGGLIGQIEHNVTVQKCYSTGSVEGQGHMAGGFIGVVGADDITVTVSKCYSTGNVTMPHGDSGNWAHTGGFLGTINGSGSGAAPIVNIDNCYCTGAVATRRYSGGFVGSIFSKPAKLNVTNSYTNSDISGIAVSNYCGSFIGLADARDKGTEITCKGFVAWDPTSRGFSYGDCVSVEGNYYGSEGSVTSQATALGWDSSIWNLTGTAPTLK